MSEKVYVIQRRMGEGWVSVLVFFTKVEATHVRDTANNLESGWCRMVVRYLCEHDPNEESEG
jgi:hypothetical protein